MSKNKIAEEIEKLSKKCGEEGDFEKSLSIAEKESELWRKTEKCKCCGGFGYVAKKGE